VRVVHIHHRWCGWELGKHQQGCRSTASTFGQKTVNGLASTRRSPELPLKPHGAVVKNEVATRWGKARRAGTKPEAFFPGDVVVIVNGEEVGRTATVLDVLGHAYRSDNKVVVRNGVGELVFYLPWDLERIEESDDPSGVQ